MKNSSNSLDIKQAMILSAGMGRRLGALTSNTPKPLIKVGEQAILLRILDALEYRGFERVAVNCHYLAEQIKSAIAEWQTINGNSKMEVFISHEEEKLLEIGGGIRNVLEFFNDKPFLVVNGDIVWQEHREPLVADLISDYQNMISKGQKVDALMALSPVENVQEFRQDGDLELLADASIKFKEQSENLTHVYMGLQVVDPKLVEHLEKGEANYLRPCWIKSQQESRLFGHVYNGTWADMGTPEGLSIAERIVA